MLCSKSARPEGRSHIGPVQVACRIWVRCRSLTPGSWPVAWYRWSQSPAGMGSMVRIQARWPGIPVVNRQVPYPPGGPGPAGVKVNPVCVLPGGLVPRGGGRGGWFPVPSGGRARSVALARPGPRLRGSGRAQACPVARPRASVTVRHHDVAGFAAEAAARSRASHGSTGPRPGSSPARSARPSRVASGTVRWFRPANPAGTGPPPDPGGPVRAGRVARAVLGRGGAAPVSGAGVLVQEQVQGGPGAQHVHPARDPGRAELPGPPGDAAGRPPGPGPGAPRGWPGRRCRSPRPTVRRGRSWRPARGGLSPCAGRPG